MFEATQAKVLAEVIQIAYNDLVKTGDFNELKDIVRQLAEAQGRTEQRLEERARAQEQLAQAQARTNSASKNLPKRCARLPAG